MINQLIKPQGNGSETISTSALLRHPFFLINNQRARDLLLLDHSDIKDAVCVKKLEEWKNSVIENSFSQDCDDVLKEIIVSK